MVMEMIEKISPRDLDAEEAVIGSLLIDGKAIRLIAEKLKPGDFFYGQNESIYFVCLDLHKRRDGVNQITIAQELSRQGKLDQCGGAAHLSYLISICPTPLDIEQYASVVKRLSASRQMITLSEQLSGLGYESDPDTNRMIENGIKLFDNYRKANTTFNELVTPLEASQELIDLMSKYNEPGHAMSWGYKDLDGITTGIYPEFVIVGARPSVGKTQIMKDIAENISLQGKTVLFASAEMSISALMERKIARELGISVKEIRRVGIPPEDMDKVIEISGQVSQNKLYYLPHGVSSKDVYNQAKRMKETIGLDIIFVDYLQFLTDCWTGKENQNVRVGEACKRLKSIVNDLEIPVIVASQLNRSLELRSDDNNKPKLADLRDSGNIEQDADVVLLLWRDPENDKILEIKMAKNRQLGQCLSIKLKWDTEKYRYSDYNKPA